MAKKTFKNNPALQFISSPIKDEIEKEKIENEDILENTTQNENILMKSENLEIKKDEEKINFPEILTEEPIVEKLTTHQTVELREQIKEQNIALKVNPNLVEVKTRRYVCLFAPTLFDKLKNKATSEKKSINEIMNLLVEEYLQD